MISLYFHIPFCSRKCPYCHFYVVPNQARFRHLLLEALRLEWAQIRPQLEGKQIASIYFGGGTPSLFGPAAIEELLDLCRTVPWSPQCEVTLEANPEESDPALFTEYRAVGINRLSLGVQSLDDRALATLERQHNALQAKQAIQSAAAAGIQNISIDLMYDLPDQTESSWQYTLDQLAELPIQHLSLYNLTIEPHTSFAKRPLHLPPQDLSLRLLERALEKFSLLGFERYEISAFSRPGSASQHNLGYWTFRPFWGLGPSAFSDWDKERFQNVPHLQRYARSLRENKSPVHFREKLSSDKRLREELAVRLRLTEGAPLSPLISVETQETIDRLVARGWLRQKGEIVQLTDAGKLFYDSVATELI